MVVRPSYVLGGRAMEIAHNDEQLRRFGAEAVKVSGENPILIDQYLADAIEVDVDCICDAVGQVYVAGVMEHIEEAGIHSGDSACSLPPYSLPPAIVTELKAETEAMARALKVQGLMNVQYAVKDGEIFVLEVNPRASRTVPFVAKATGVAVAKIGARVMAGEHLSAFNLDDDAVSRHVAVKEAVFPFNRFPNVDVILGPEMKSTGEVMGLDHSFERAFLKAQLGAGVKLPEAGHRLHLGEGERQGGGRDHGAAAGRHGLLASWPPAAPRRASARPGLRCRSSTRCWKAGRIAWTP